MASELSREHIDKASRYFSESRDALLESASGLVESQWKFKKHPERWSIAEIVEHVVLFEENICVLVAGIDEASDAAPDRDPVRIDDFIRFTKVREQAMQLLFNPALRARTVNHPMFGSLDGYQWLLSAAAHGERHTDQIRKVKEEPDFPSSQEPQV